MIANLIAKCVFADDGFIDRSHLGNFIRCEFLIEFVLYPDNGAFWNLFQGYNSIPNCVINIPEGCIRVYHIFRKSGPNVRKDNAGDERDFRGKIYQGKGLTTLYIFIAGTVGGTYLSLQPL